MRQIRNDDWEGIVAVVNVIIAIVMLSLLRRTGEDYYAMAAVWCAATAVFVLIRIFGRVLHGKKG